jgi:hypothetical protein
VRTGKATMHRAHWKSREELGSQLSPTGSLGAELPLLGGRDLSHFHLGLQLINEGHSHCGRRSAPLPIYRLPSQPHPEDVFTVTASLVFDWILWSCGLGKLTSKISHHKIHSSCCVYQYFTPFPCSVAFHGVDVPVYLAFTHRRTWIISSFGYYKKCCYEPLCTSICMDRSCHFSGKNAQERELGCMMSICLTLQEPPERFPERLHHWTLPQSMRVQGFLFLYYLTRIWYCQYLLILVILRDIQWCLIVVSFAFP